MAIRRQVFNRLAPASPGYTIEYELTIGAMRAGMKIAGLPTIEERRIGGETKGDSWPTGVTFLKFFLGEVQPNLQYRNYFWPYSAVVAGLLMAWILLRLGRHR